MSRAGRWITAFSRLRDAARRELLRDPDVTLFQRNAEQVHVPTGDRVGR